MRKTIRPVIMLTLLLTAGCEHAMTEALINFGVTMVPELGVAAYRMASRSSAPMPAPANKEEHRP